MNLIEALPKDNWQNYGDMPVTGSFIEVLLRGSIVTDRIICLQSLLSIQ